MYSDRHADGRPREVSTLDRDNPFLGLEPFKEADAAWFFGRERDAAELAQMLRRTGPAVVYGASGLGKTSLLRAGLFPKLREQGVLPIYVHTIYQPGLPDVLGQVRAAIEEELDARGVDAEGPRADQTLWEYFHQTPLWDERNRLLAPVLVFDQFEELFTVGRRHEGRDELIEALTDLIENHIPASVRARVEAGETELPPSYERPKVKVVLSLREDFLPELAALEGPMPSLRQNRYRLTPLRGTDAVQAVLGPGAHIIDEAVAHDIVRFVASAGAHATAQEAGEAELDELRVEPPLLNLVCRELNERRLRARAAKVTAELLAGSRETILRDFYERATADLGPAARVFVEDRLLTARGFRTTVALQDALEAPGVNEAVIGALVDRRLLRREERLGIPHVELVHDVMTRFVAESRDRRRAADGVRAEESARWRRYRTYGASALVVLLGLLVFVGYKAFQNAADAARAAKALAAQEQAASERAQAAALSSLTRLVETLTTLAGADLARGERATAIGRLALAHTASGGRRIELPVRTWVETRTFGALRSLVELESALGRRVARLAVSPDGERVVLVGGDGAARLARVTAGGLELIGVPMWAQPEEAEVDRGARPQRMQLREEAAPARSDARVVAAAWSGDGAYVVLADDRGRVERRRAADGALRGVWPGLDGGVEELVVSRDGATIAARGPNSGGAFVTVLRADGEAAAAKPARAPEAFGVVAAFALDDAGRRLAVASRGRNAVVIWELDGEARERVVELGAEPSALAMSRDGARLLVGTMEGGLFDVDAATGRAQATGLRWASPVLGLSADAELSRAVVRPEAGGVAMAQRVGDGASNWQVAARYWGHRGKVRTAVMGGAGGAWVATSSSADGMVRVWEAATGRLLDAHAHEGADVQAWLSRGGRTVLSLAADGALRVFDRDAAATGSDGRTLSRGLESPGAEPDGAVVGVHPRAGAVAPAMSADGRRVATVGADGTARLWQRRGAAWERADCAGLGSAGEVVAVGFSGDGQRVRLDVVGGGSCEWALGRGERQTVQAPAQRCGGVLVCRDAQRGAPAGPEARSVPVGGDGQHLVEARPGELAVVGPDGARLRSLLGHTGAVTSVAVSADGALGLTGASDGTVRLWDLARGQALAYWGGDAEGEAAAAFSPDEAALVLILPGGQVEVVANPARGAAAAASAPALRCRGDHTAAVTALTFNERGSRLVSGGADGCVVQHPLDSDHELPEVALDEPVRGLGYVGQEWLLVEGRTPRLYNATSGSRLADLAPPDGSAAAFARPSPAGDAVTVVDAHGGVATWSLAPPGPGAGTATLVAQWRAPIAGRSRGVTAIAASVRAARFALGDEAGGVAVGAAGEGVPVAVAGMPDGPIRALDFDAAGARLLALTATAARVYSLDDPAATVTLPSGGGLSADLAPTGDRVIVARDDGAVEIWQLGAAQPSVSAQLGCEEVGFAASGSGHALAWRAHADEVFVFSPVGDGGFEITSLALAQGVLAAAIAPDGLSVLLSSVQTLSRSSGDLRAPSAMVELGGTRFAHALAFASGGEAVVAGLGSEGVAVFAAADLVGRRAPELSESWVLRTEAAGPRVASLGGDLASVWQVGVAGAPIALDHDGDLPIDVAFGPGPDRVTTLTESGTARVWRLDSPAAAESTHLPVELLAATWPAAGPRVATLSAAGLVEVWSDAHGAARPWLTRSLGAGFRATASTTSADGTVLALGSSTGEVALTPLDGDAPPVFATTADGTRASHGSPVSALALGAGRLASASAEGDIRLWSLDGAPVAQIALQGERVTALTFAAGSRLLLASTDQGRVRGYEASLGGPLFVVDTGLSPARLAAVDRAARRLATTGGRGAVRLWPLALPEAEVDRLRELAAPTR